MIEHDTDAKRPGFISFPAGGFFTRSNVARGRGNMLALAQLIYPVTAVSVTQPQSPLMFEGAN